MLLQPSSSLQRDQAAGTLGDLFVPRCRPADV